MNTPPAALSQILASLGIDERRLAEGGAVVSHDVAAQLMALLGYAAGGQVQAPAPEMTEEEMLMKLLGPNYYDFASQNIFNEREPGPVQVTPYGFKVQG